MKQFNEKEQIRFWSANDHPFKGDIVADVILSLSKKHMGKNAIDVGAGSGALAKRFKEKYKNKKQIIALDLVPKGEHVKKGGCTKLKFKENCFDTYFCTDVIEHLSDKDLEKCLNEANRVLKIGGHAIFTTINNEKLSESVVVCPECECKFHRWGHCQVFTESRIKSLFEKKGFSIKKVRKVNLGLLAKFKFIINIIYSLRMDNLLNLNFLNTDLFFVVKKVKEI